MAPLALPWLNLLTQGMDPDTQAAILLAVYGLIVALGLGAGAFGIWRNLHRLAEVEAMLDGGFGDQFPADVTIVAEGKSLGSDRGVVWFADGLMGFSGGAASFVLAPEDVTPRVASMRQAGRTVTVRPNAVILRDAPKAAYVAVTPLGGHGNRYRSRLSAFLPGRGTTEDERLVRYVMATGATSGERHWPPLEPYREDAEANG